MYSREQSVTELTCVTTRTWWTLGRRISHPRWEASREPIRAEWDPVCAMPATLNPAPRSLLKVTDTSVARWERLKATPKPGWVQVSGMALTLRLNRSAIWLRSRVRQLPKHMCWCINIMLLCTRVTVHCDWGCILHIIQILRSISSTLEQCAKCNTITMTAVSFLF